MRAAFRLAIYCVTAFVLTAESSAADLRGRVVDEADLPISNALVTIWIARPIIGRGSLCPSCYIDCGRTATTDAEGSFTFVDVADDLQFTVVAAGVGFRAQQSGWLSDTEAVVKLRAIPADLPSDRLLQGEVTNEQGRPIAFAEIEPSGIRYAGGGVIYKSMRGRSDEIALSDDEGNFSIVMEQPTEAISLRVRSRGYAPCFLQDLELSPEPHSITLHRGASLIGRVTRDDEGIPHRIVGLCPMRRTIPEGMTGWASFDQTVETDADGIFRFDDLPVEFDFYLYSHSLAMHDDATEIYQVKTPAAEQQLDVGHLPLELVHRIRGRIEMPEGHPIPENVRMTVSRTDVWDHCEIQLRPDGTFEVIGVRKGVTAVSVTIPGYRLDWDLNNFQQTYDNQLSLLVEGDVNDLQIHMATQLEP